MTSVSNKYDTVITKYITNTLNLQISQNCNIINNLAFGGLNNKI